jgi:hypothetical protein
MDKQGRHCHDTPAAGDTIYMRSRTRCSENLFVAHHAEFVRTRHDAQWTVVNSRSIEVQSQRHNSSERPRWRMRIDHTGL